MLPFIAHNFTEFHLLFLCLHDFISRRYSLFVNFMMENEGREIIAFRSLACLFK